MRFVCCMMVVFFHCSYNLVGSIPKETYQLGFFYKGYIGVEFFFVVSGFLMAKSIVTQTASVAQAASVSESSSGTYSLAGFMWQKIKAILPYHVLAWFAMFVICITTNKSWGTKNFFIKYLLDKLPGLFLIERWGFDTKSLNGVQWYLSAMLVAMALIYPLFRKSPDKYRKTAAPIIALAVLGWLVHDYGTFGNVKEWTPIGYKCVWRAIGELNLGIFGYSVVEFINKENYNKKEKLGLTIFELISWGLFILYAVTAVPSKYDFLALFAVFFAVCLAFSEQTYLSGLFDNRFVYFLGRLSLPIYITQKVGFKIVEQYFTTYAIRYQILITVSLALIFGLINMLISEQWMKRINKSHFNQMMTALPK